MKYLFFGSLVIALAGITYSIAPEIAHYIGIGSA